MKATTLMKGRRSIVWIMTAVLTATGFSACHKFDWKDHPHDHSGLPTSFSSEIIEKWMDLQIRLMQKGAGVPNHGYSRHYTYSGIAAWESLAPGMPQSVQLKSKWSGLTGLPQYDHRKRYYWPANVNAALASMNRSFFPNASNEDKAAIDSLEDALNNHFRTRADQNTLTRSAQFGKAVAAAVFAWAETDGYKIANNDYTPPTGPGKWVPSPGSPADTKPLTPYWGNNRPVIRGSINNTAVVAPPAYSTNPNSTFYKMVKHVYDTKNNATPDQQAMAYFWRDVPGVTSPGHWLSILRQVVDKTNSSLAKAAFAYALTGAAINDGLIACFKDKYKYALVRPVTYVRDVMGDTAWNSLIGTPNHPEYPSAHSSLSAAAGEVFQKIFGHIGPFTDHTYDYLGFAPRTYATLVKIGEEAGYSRLPAGIHYQQSIDAGLWQGRKVALNISNLCPGL